MDRRMFDIGLPMLYALVVAVVALTSDGALVVVAVAGAMLLGIYYAAVRPSLVRREQAGSGPTPY